MCAERAGEEVARPLWLQGLTGDGEVAQVTDTPLYEESCYLADEDPSHAFGSPEHRKVISLQVRHAYRR